MDPIKVRKVWLHTENGVVIGPTQHTRTKFEDGAAGFRLAIVGDYAGVLIVHEDENEGVIVGMDAVREIRIAQADVHRIAGIGTPVVPIAKTQARTAKDVAS